MGRQVDRRGALEELFAARYWSVRAYVLRRGAAAAAEDVVAETFLVAWRRLDTLGDDPLPWLPGVARRVLANQQRADRRRGALAVRLQTLLPGQTLEWEPPATMSDEYCSPLTGCRPSTPPLAGAALDVILSEASQHYVAPARTEPTGTLATSAERGQVVTVDGLERPRILTRAPPVHDDAHARTGAPVLGVFWPGVDRSVTGVDRLSARLVTVTDNRSHSRGRSATKEAVAMRSSRAMTAGITAAPALATGTAPAHAALGRASEREAGTGPDPQLLMVADLHTINRATVHRFQAMRAATGDLT